MSENLEEPLWSYHPDNWVIVRVDSKQYGIFFKVLGGWLGGYLYGSSWRMNSGITDIKLIGDYYYIYGYSGSIYKCHKDSEEVRMNIAGVLEGVIKQDPERVSQVSIEDCVKEMESLKK